MTDDRRLVRLLGNSIALFGISGIVSSIVALIMMQAGNIDLVQLLLIWNGIAVRRGSDRAVYWATILTGIYAFSGILLTILFVSGAGINALGNRDTTVQQNPWLFAVLLPLCGWTTANFLGCLYVRRRRQRINRGLCARCAYPVGESDLCTECGTAVKR